MRARDPVLDALAGRIQQSAAEQASRLSDVELGGPLPQKVLVTGSSGYVGAALCKALRLRGATVVGLDPRSSPETDIQGKVEDAGTVGQAMDGCQAVVHTAALHAPHDKMYTEEDYRRVNIQGTAIVLAAAKERGCDVVFSSTTSLTITPEVKERMAGGQCVWLDETATPCTGDLEVAQMPRNKYGRTKREAERLCLEAAEEGQHVVVLRISRCFPEDVLEETSTPLPSLKASELLGRRVALVDVLQAHLQALARASRIKYVKCTLCAPWPLAPERTPSDGRAVAQELQARFPRAAELYQRQGWSFPDSFDRAYDSRSAVEQLGWKPRWTFERLLQCLEESGEDGEVARLGRF